MGQPLLHGIIKRNYFQKIFIKPCLMSVLGLQNGSCAFSLCIFHFFLPDQPQKMKISNLKTQVPRQRLETHRLPRRPLPHYLLFPETWEAWKGGRAGW